MLPLSSETRTRSPAARLALRVPVSVCAATRVMKSVLLSPLAAVSLARARLATVVVGAVVSST